MFLAAWPMLLSFRYAAINQCHKDRKQVQPSDYVYTFHKHVSRTSFLEECILHEFMKNAYSHYHVFLQNYTSDIRSFAIKHCLHT